MRNHVARRMSAALLAASVLAGCAGRDTVAEDEVRLGNAVMAMYLSPYPSHSFFSWGKDPGYVLLVDPDGATRAIETSGMDAAQMTWTKAGLFFADDKRDYLLGENGLATTDSPKPGTQTSMHEVDGTFVGVYGGGSDSTLVAHRDGQSQSHGRSGFLGVVSRCGNKLAGVSDAPLSENGSSGEADVDSDPSKVLQHLWPAPAKAIATRPPGPDAEDPQADDAPCVDGVVHALWEQPHGKRDVEGVRKERLMLQSWNTVTGERTDREVLDEEGRPFPPDESGLGRSRHAEQVVRGDELLWWGSEGRSRATRLTDGRTRELFATTTGGSAEAVFTDDYLYVLDAPADAPASEEELVLTRYSLATGKGEQVVRIPDVDSLITGDMVRWGIAVRPGGTP